MTNSAFLFSQIRFQFRFLAPNERQGNQEPGTLIRRRLNQCLRAVFSIIEPILLIDQSRAVLPFDKTIKEKRLNDQMRHLLMRHKWLARHRTSRISPNRPNIEERFWFSFLMGNLSKSAAAGNCSRLGKTLALPAFSLIAWKCQQQQRLLFSFIWSFATVTPLLFVICLSVCW